MTGADLFSPTFWMCVGLSLVPILGWIWFFQAHHSEKRKYVVLTFVAGMAAVIPIKFYEKYWNTALLTFEHFNLFQYLAELTQWPSLDRLLAFVSVNALVALFLFVFAAAIMFLLEVISGDNSIKTFREKTKKVFESPLIFVFIGVLCGLVGYFFSFSFSQKVWFFVIVGMLEEYIKHLVLRFSDDEKINSVSDALSFSIIGALGFAFVENAMYLKNFLVGTPLGASMPQFLIFLFLRSTVSVIAHVCFSAIFGYFYGVSRFTETIYARALQQNQFFWVNVFHSIVHLKKSTIFKEQRMMEGMLLAVVLHATFNLLLEWGKIQLLIPLLLFLFFIVLNLFHRKQIYIQSGVVQTNP